MCVVGEGGVIIVLKLNQSTAAFEIRKWKPNFPIDLVTHYDPVNRMAPCQGTAQLQFGSCDPLRPRSLSMAQCHSRTQPVLVLVTHYDLGH